MHDSPTILTDLQVTGERDSSAGIVMGYGLETKGSIPEAVKKFLSSPQCPDRLQGLPSLLSNEYRERFPQR
jgi:hypothetical protein